MDMDWEISGIAYNTILRIVYTNYFRNNHESRRDNVVVFVRSNGDQSNRCTERTT